MASADTEHTGSPPPGSALLEMQDMVSSVEDYPPLNPPEQSARPSGERFVVVRPLE